MSSKRIKIITDTNPTILEDTVNRFINTYDTYTIYDIQYTSVKRDDGKVEYSVMIYYRNY